MLLAHTLSEKGVGGMQNQKPETSVKQPHQVILEGREKLLISVVEEAECFDNIFAVLRTVMGRMEIQGEDLCVSDLTLDARGSGSVSMTGKISALFYSDDIRPFKRRKKSGG